MYSECDGESEGDMCEVECDGESEGTCIVSVMGRVRVTCVR